MVGPVVKIPPESLPQRPNIEYLGQRSYQDLPALVAQWDVCLLPFALNDATRYISPTKTLEYMAAGKPSVSTPINDVVECFGEHRPDRRHAARIHRGVRGLPGRIRTQEASRRRRRATRRSRRHRGMRPPQAMRELIDSVWRPVSTRGRPIETRCLARPTTAPHARARSRNGRDRRRARQA